MESRVVFIFFYVLTGFVLVNGFIHQFSDGSEEIDIIGPEMLLGRSLRTKREATEPPHEGGPRHKKKHHFSLPPFRYCCGGENNMDDKKSHEEKMKGHGSCFKKVENETSEWSKFGNPTKDPFTCDFVAKFRDMFLCVSECEMKEFGIFNDDGSVDSDKLTKYITKDIKYDWLQELATKAVPKCSGSKGNSWLKYGEESKCSPRSINIKHCIWQEIILTCPEEHLDKNDYCKRVKEAFEEVEA